MLVQNFFPRELLSDHKLVAILVYGLTTAKSHRSTYALDNDEVIELNPFQVAYPYRRIESELGLKRDELEAKLQKIQQLKQGTITKMENVALLQLSGMDSHMTSTNFTPEEVEGRSMSISQWIEKDSETYLKSKSKSLQRDTPSSMRQFIEVIGDLAISQVTGRDCQRFISAKKGKIEDRSINCYMRNIKASLRRASAMGYIIDDPFKGIKQLP